MSKTKLWNCSVELHFVVASDKVPTDYDLREIALLAVSEDVLTMTSKVSGEIICEKDLPAHWDTTCIPYEIYPSCGGLDKTIGEMLSE